MGETEVSFNFPLNGNVEDPSIKGIEAVLETYRQNLSAIEFRGPTNFAPFLRDFHKRVSERKDEQVFDIMVIMTDGKISDMGETKDAIYELSYLPCSIIIIGIGNA